MVAYGDEWLDNESVGKKVDEIATLSTGNQVVPTIEPDWDYNTAKGRWDQSHFVRCVLEGLRQALAKTLNYVKLESIEQEEKEVPGKFLDSLRESESEVAQLVPTLCNSTNWDLPGSSVYRIFQARVQEWIAISFSRVSSQPRDWTQVSRIVGRCFTIWATREKPFTNFTEIDTKSEEGRVILKDIFLTQ